MHLLKSKWPNVAWIRSRKYVTISIEMQLIACMNLTLFRVSDAFSTMDDYFLFFALCAFCFRGFKLRQTVAMGTGETRYERKHSFGSTSISHAYINMDKLIWMDYTKQMGTRFAGATFLIKWIVSLQANEKRRITTKLCLILWCQLFSNKISSLTFCPHNSSTKYAIPRIVYRIMGIVTPICYGVYS